MSFKRTTPTTNCRLKRHLITTQLPLEPTSTAPTLKATLSNGFCVAARKAIFNQIGKVPNFIQKFSQLNPIVCSKFCRLGDLGGSNLDAAQKASAGFCTSKVQIMRKHTTSRLINFKIFSNNP